MINWRAAADRPFPEQRRGAFLGVQTQELTADLKDRLGVAVDKGVLVTDVLLQEAGL